jgi:hypothetical protein
MEAHGTFVSFAAELVVAEFRDDRRPCDGFGIAAVRGFVVGTSADKAGSSIVRPKGMVCGGWAVVWLGVVGVGSAGAVWEGGERIL